MCALFIPEIVQAGAAKELKLTPLPPKKVQSVQLRFRVDRLRHRLAVKTEPATPRDGDELDHVVGKYRPRIRAGLLPLPGWRIPNPGRLQRSEAPPAAHLHRWLDLTL